MEVVRKEKGRDVDLFQNTEPENISGPTPSFLSPKNSKNNVVG
jgi:hypothetical protein